MKKIFLIALLCWATVAGAAYGASLDVSNVDAGAPITVQWSGATTTRDWIAIYNAGAGDGSFQSWFYVNAGSGAGNFPGRAAGTYDIRMFYNDGWQRIATAQVVVGQSQTPPPPTGGNTSALSVGCPQGTTPATVFHICYDANTEAGIYPRGPLLDVTDNTRHSGHYECQKSRGSRGARLSVADGDYLCAFYAAAFDGVSFVPAGYIVWKADGWPTPGAMGTSLVFAVRSHAGGMLEALTLRRVGNAASLEGQAINIAAPEIRLPYHAQGGNRYVCIDAQGVIFVSPAYCN